MLWGCPPSGPSAAGLDFRVDRSRKQSLERETSSAVGLSWFRAAERAGVEPWETWAKSDLPVLMSESAGRACCARKPGNEGCSSLRAAGPALLSLLSSSCKVQSLQKCHPMQRWEVGWAGGSCARRAGGTADQMGTFVLLHQLGLAGMKAEAAGLACAPLELPRRGCR